MFPSVMERNSKCTGDSFCVKLGLLADVHLSAVHCIFGMSAHFVPFLRISLISKHFDKLKSNFNYVESMQK